MIRRNAQVILMELVLSTSRDDMVNTFIPINEAFSQFSRNYAISETGEFKKELVEGRLVEEIVSSVLSSRSTLMLG